MARSFEIGGAIVAIIVFCVGLGFSLSQDNPNPTLSLLMAGGCSFLIVAIGFSLAFWQRFKAQIVLCQVQIEENTRH